MNTPRPAIVFIPLTQGKCAVIDFDDYEKIRGTKWYARKKDRRWYAHQTISKKVPLHRFLLGLKDRVIQVDHIDGDGLNNTRANLRICNNQQNHFAKQRKELSATSQFRGVCWHQAAQKWIAQIKYCGKNFYLGLFSNEIAAAQAYDEKARELFGEFASLNFPC